MPTAIEVFRSKLKAALAPYGAASEFCRKAKISRTAVERWLKSGGGPAIGSLERIAHALGQEPWQLLRPEEPPNSLVLAPIPGWDTLAEELRQLAQGDAAELVAQWLDTLRLFKAALERQKLRDGASQGEPDNG